MPRYVKTLLVGLPIVFPALSFQIGWRHPPVGRVTLSRAVGANALKELAKRTDGEEGDRLIGEAIELFQRAAIALEQLPNKTDVAIARSNVAHALSLRAERGASASAAQDVERARELYAQVGRELTKEKNPRLRAAVKQNEAELLRLIGKREADQAQAFRSLKASFELYQEVLGVISKDTAPNTWAMVCAELGHTLAAVLPLLSDQDREQTAKNAVAALGAARPFFVAGGFGQDLQRLDEALRVVHENK
jgi:hypothetical protein